jgi:hypothetical protein
MLGRLWINMLLLYGSAQGICEEHSMQLAIDPLVVSAPPLPLLPALPLPLAPPVLELDLGSWVVASAKKELALRLLLLELLPELEGGSFTIGSCKCTASRCQ